MLCSKLIVLKNNGFRTGGFKRSLVSLLPLPLCRQGVPNLGDAGGIKTFVSGAGAQEKVGNPLI
jgi:hypothetical protein